MHGPIRARKSLGQNFLVDPGIQRRIIAAVDPHPEDVILEIGPGQGALTQHLVDSGARVIAIELDDRLAPLLRRQFADKPNFSLLHKDALTFAPADINVDMARVKLVGNIPYNITTPLIFHFLERSLRPNFLILMVQKEVADRIIAAPGSKDYGALSVGVRTVATADRLFNVGRGAFRPVPNVESSIIRITPMAPPPFSDEEEARIRELTRTAFAWRRKQLQKILRASDAYHLTPEQVLNVHHQTGIDLNLRPEALSPEQFIQLAGALQNP